MKYIPLKKIYYKNLQNLDIWMNEYNKRFTAPNTKHLQFMIHEIDRKESFPAFFCYTEEIATLLNKILTKMVALLNCISEVPQAAVDQFLYSSLVNEVQFSNDIEGIRSTRKEIKDALTQVDPQKYIRFWGIVDKYKKIITRENINLKTCHDVRNLYDNFVLKEVTKADPKNFPDGEIFRKGSVDVQTASQIPIHRGLFPESEIISYLSNALHLLHNKDLPFLVRISIFHYLFGYIHPFYDGNGRMSRFITSYLLSKELHATAALQVSFLIKANKKQYYEIFEDTTSNWNRGDLTPFITYSLELIYFAVRTTTNELSKKWTKYNYYLPLIEKLPLSNDITTKHIYKILLQAAIFSDYGATIEEIAKSIEKSPKTIKSRFDKIPSITFIVTKSSRPYHYKINIDYLKNLK